MNRSEYFSFLRNRVELQRRINHWMQGPLAILALVYLALLIVALVVPLTPRVAGRLVAAETAIYVVFVLDFLVELALAPHTLRYIKRHWLAAIAVVLPFLRVASIFRFVGLVRGASLLEILTGLNRGTRAIGTVIKRGGLGYVLALTGIVVLTAAAATYYFEQGQPGADIHTFGEALYWAATVVTTMSIGLEPQSVEGRVIAILLRIYALGIAGYLTAIIAAYLLGVTNPRTTVSESSHQRELRQLHDDVTRLSQMLARRSESPPQDD
ncbi:MAG: ion transporter [Chloroflexota bacterium]